VFISTLIVTLVRHNDNPTGLLIWCFIGFCTGIGLFFYGFRLLQRRRLILDTPFSKIRSAAMGMVEISGQAVGPFTLTAPITARPCYYYRTLVWEYKQRGKNKEWVKIAGECFHVPFFIDDNTGRMLVDPRGADLDLHRDFQQEFCDGFFTMKEPAPPNVREFLARHGIVTNNKIKVEEFCIKPKNALFILGTLAENSGYTLGPTITQDADAIQSSLSKRLPVGTSITIRVNGREKFHAEGSRLTGMFNEPQPNGGFSVGLVSTKTSPDVKVLDVNQQKIIADALVRAAGISNRTAWPAAGVSQGTAVAIAPDSSVQQLDSVTTANLDDFDAHPPVVLKQGENNRLFIISWRSQREVAQSLGWKSALMIWGGAALALFTLYFFLGINHLL